MDNQSQNPVTPQNDLPVSEIVSALKSAPAATPPVSPLQEITPAPMPTSVSSVVSPAIPAAPTPVAPRSEAQIPSIPAGQPPVAPMTTAPTTPSAPAITPANPLAEDPDQVISPGSK